MLDGLHWKLLGSVDGILLRPLPFPDHERLVAIDTMQFPPGAPTNQPDAGWVIETSYPNFFDWQRQNHTLQSIASYRETARLFAKANSEGAQVIGCGRVSASLFTTLGVAPELGRTFTEEEKQTGQVRRRFPHRNHRLKAGRARSNGARQ
jgi:hypothetical protein